MKILLVENDFNFSAILKKRLAGEGHNVRATSSQEKALGLMRVDKYDLVITEYKTGELNGLEFVGATHFLDNTPEVILMLTPDEKKAVNKLCPLNFSRYAEKPISLNELMEKVKAFSSNANSVADIYTCGDLVIDLSDRTVRRGDKDIKLSYKEFELLLLLVKNKNKVVSRDLISNALYDWNEYIESNAIDVYIRYLRVKVDEGFENKMIQTIRRVGYIIKG